MKVSEILRFGNNKIVVRVFVSECLYNTIHIVLDEFKFLNGFTTLKGILVISITHTLKHTRPKPF